VLRDRARDDGVESGRGGAVVVIQRFGGALNLNVHFYALVLDGVFAGEPGTLGFHPVGGLTALDVEEVLAAVEALVDRRLRASGGSDDDGMASDPWVNEAPLLAGLAAASVQGVSALTPRPGRRPARLGNIVAAAQADAVVAGSCAARANGFSRRAAGGSRAAAADQPDPVLWRPWGTGDRPGGGRPWWDQPGGPGGDSGHG
jgi:hypothetical protein